ncbi:putative low molecular weight protein-tyrosine-phosphatase EpsP [Paraburkholderia unamae]|uniref:low molecular weight protein-tyrosine-phosphatase n=1 Tax=Paraburkholderia unamae TaxID=219649 RepID=UPI001CAADFA4|nr:low molecular weight protein-tyrosine-phosphatase [Paraburkholderia unamae]CAG9270804.1 putative low molecular weight protein-tyrosine-phosphatase EpsP [Paraburkholderia unamae]
MIERVLVVCEGNICRSPLACAMLARSLPDIGFSSAGTHALVGEGADPLIVEMARDRGVVLGDHVATPLTDERVRDADLILTMTRTQREQIERAWPFARGKVFRLIETEGIDIVDPYRRHRATFDLAVAQIEHGVAHWRNVLAGKQVH